MAGCKVDSLRPLACEIAKALRFPSKEGNRGAFSMQTEGPLKLNIRNKDLREKIESEIIRQMQESISGSEQRNDDLREMDEQMQMITGITDNGPWKDSCTLATPTTLDQILTLAAMMSAAMQRELKALVEAVRAKDEKSAQSLEYYIAHKHYEAGYNKVVDHVIYNALRWPYSILYDGWKEERRAVRSIGYVPEDDETAAPVEEDAKLPGVAYTEVPIVNPGELVYKGLEMRAVNSTDFYLSPPDAISIESATACGEIQTLTRHDLLDGIETMGLDRDKVYTLLQKGPTNQKSQGASDYKEVEDSRDGIDSDPNSFEVMIWYTRIPLIFESDKMITPKYLLQDELLCIAVPAENIMLRMDFAPEGRTRPYIKHCMLDIPERFMGWCIPRMLDAIQAEANATVQMGINVMNFELQPMLKAPEREAQRYQNLQASPGKVVFYKTSPDEIQPLYFPNTLRGNQETLAMLENRAEKLVSAGGFGSYQPKQRKNAETQAVQQAAFSKFDHYLSNFQRGVEETHRHSAALLADHMDEEGEEFMDPFDNARKVTPQDLKRKFVFKPTANSTNTDPATRIEMGRELAEVVSGYWAVHDEKGQDGQPAHSPQAIKAIWHTSRELILAMGKHSVETYIGDEPEVMEPGEATPPPMDYTPMSTVNSSPMGGMNGAGNGYAELGFAPQ